jgi:uncharacterized membrane protein YgcG
MSAVRGDPLRYGKGMRRAVLLGLGLLALAAPVSAKSYRISKVVIEARLGGDGSLWVKESRTYAFEGRFRYAFRTLPTGHGEIYEAIRVSEDGNALILADTGEPSTFRVTPGGDAIEVRWFFRAQSKRTFDLEYRVQPVAQRHADTALLHYQFIGSDWDVPQRDVRVHVQPPRTLAPDSVRVWLHGPLWGEVGLDPDGGITATCARVPPHVAFEIRALYPPAILPDVPLAAGAVREGVMQEEARWAEDANRLRAEAQRRIAARAARRSLGWRVLPLIGLAGIVGGYLLWRARGTRPAVPESSAQALVSALPSETPPAFVGYLLNGRQVSGADLTATLFDLARRGFLVLQEGRAERRQLFGGTRTVSTYTLVLKRDALQQNASQLLPHEAGLLAFIFDVLARGGDTIEMEAIKKQQSRMARYFTTWSRQVKSEARARDYFDAESVRGYHYALAIGIALLVLTVPAVLVFGLAGVSLAAAGVVGLVLSCFIPHRTLPGETEARQWKGLKRYLQNYGAPGVAPTDPRLHLDAFLVYGIVLGLGAKTYRTLVGRLAPGDAGTHIPWYVAHDGAGGFDAGGFAGAFSSMVATATSTVSSAAGTGGGASGGGGGGAGGGGGGAG